MMLRLFLDSSHLFNGEEFTADIKLLDGWSKESLIRNISRINYLVHPHGRKYHNIRDCVDLWNKTTYSDKQIATGILSNALKKYSVQKEHWYQEAVFFNRLTNLYILKKILVTEFYKGVNFKDNLDEKKLINFLRFYSACTKEVLAHERAESPSELSLIEAIAFKNLPQHVYNSSPEFRMSYLDLIYSYLNYTFKFSEISV